MSLNEHEFGYVSRVIAEIQSDAVRLGARGWWLNREARRLSSEIVRKCDWLRGLIWDEAVAP